MPPEGVAFLFTLTIIGATILLFPLVRAFAERIRGKNVDAGVREELQVLREDLLAEIQHARREIGDFGERVDFLERFIAKQPAPSSFSFLLCGPWLSGFAREPWTPRSATSCKRCVRTCLQSCSTRGRRFRNSASASTSPSGCWPRSPTDERA